jgi:hypothetical protein
LLSDRSELSQILERLRVMESVVAAGAVAMAVVWSLVAVHNAMGVMRHGTGRGYIAVGAALGVPPALWFISATTDPNQTTQMAVLVLMVQAIVLYLPFAAVGQVSEVIGGPRMPFLRWYLALGAAMLLQHVFTGPLDLANPKPSDDLGRSAVMYFANAVVIGVMVVMAAEASRAMQQATNERASQRRLLHDDASQRMRAPLTLVETPPAAVPTVVLAPPVPVMAPPIPVMAPPVAVGTTAPAFPAPTPAPVRGPQSVPVTPST